MMGLAEIKLANTDPLAHAKSQMSDGQARRNDSRGAYWSEKSQSSPMIMRGGVVISGQAIVPNTNRAELDRFDHARLNNLVAQLESELDKMAPPNPVGYTKHMGLHYAAKPLRVIVEQMKEIFLRQSAA